MSVSKKRFAFWVAAVIGLSASSQSMASPEFLGTWSVDEPHFLINATYLSYSRTYFYGFSTTAVTTQLVVEEALRESNSLVVRWKSSFQEATSGVVRQGEFKELLTCQRDGGVTRVLCRGLDDFLQVRLELLSPTNATVTILESRLYEVDISGIGRRNLPFLKGDHPAILSVRAGVAQKARWRLVKAPEARN